MSIDMQQHLARPMLLSLYWPAADAICDALLWIVARFRAIPTNKIVSKSQTPTVTTATCGWLLIYAMLTYLVSTAATVLIYQIGDCDCDNNIGVQPSKLIAA